MISVHYFIGIAMVGIGVLLVIKTEWFLENFGPIAWAEAHLGLDGGSRLMYKFIGLVFIFFGMLTVTNLLQGFLLATIGRLFLPSSIR